MIAAAETAEIKQLIIIIIIITNWTILSVAQKALKFLEIFSLHSFKWFLINVFEGKKNFIFTVLNNKIIVYIYFLFFKKLNVCILIKYSEAEYLSEKYYSSLEEFFFDINIVF